MSKGGGKKRGDGECKGLKSLNGKLKIMERGWGHRCNERWSENCGIAKRLIEK